MLLNRKMMDQKTKFGGKAGKKAAASYGLELRPRAASERSERIKDRA